MAGRALQRNGERKQHARHRRVNAGAQHEVPEQQPQRRVNDQLHHTKPIERDERNHHQCRQPEHRQREIAAVEHRDDHDGAEIVDDRERRQENFDRHRDARAQDRKHAERKTRCRLPPEYPSRARSPAKG